MKLIGVYHNPAYLEKIINYISDNCKDSLESIMLELPSNHDELAQLGIREKTSFFESIADKFRGENNSRIIYGDIARRPIPYLRKEVLKGVLDQLIFKKRSKHMAKTAKIENPALVILGMSHTNDLKKLFPDSHYIAFEPGIRGFGDYIASKIFKPYKADKIIYLEPAPLRKLF